MSPPAPAGDVFCNHTVLLDSQQKIVPWYGPAATAYDHFLRARWDFIKTRVPMCPGPAPASSYPQYYFYCAFRDKGGVLEPDTWMNDVGEKIPNWFESARLYYAYTGDESVMTIARKLADYAIEHGTSPANFAWPGFPYTTTNAGDTEFRGFTKHGKLALHEIQVDHAGDMGLTYYRLYQFYGEGKYLDAATRVADVLARHARTGSATRSVWPYRVVLDTGKITAEYGANWTGCILLLESLVRDGRGDVSAYRAAVAKARDFILQYPMQTGYWTDGHTDTDVNSSTYKSNMSASNAALYMLDHPEFDPGWKSHLPWLIKWTEENFVFRCAPGEPATQWGANIVGEQDNFLVKMDYQTARYAAQCARWFAVSGDEAYREKAYRSLNWVTYCNIKEGEAFESPVSKDVSNWWSDCYGEGPRMFYHAFAGIPEWAPPGQNHILYSAGVLRKVLYAPGEVRYTPAESSGKEYLRLAFRPRSILLDEKKLLERPDSGSEGCSLRDLGNGDFALTVRRQHLGEIIVRK